MVEIIILTQKRISDLIVNRNFDKNYPEPELLIKKIEEISKEEFTGIKETEKAVQEVIRVEEKAVSDFKKGKINVIDFLIGMVQKKLKGKGNINIIKENLLKIIQKN